MVPFLLHGFCDFILMAEMEWLLIIFLPWMIMLHFIGLRKMKVTSNSSVFRNDLEV